MNQPSDDLRSAHVELLSCLPGFGFCCRQDDSLSAVWLSSSVKEITGYSAAAFLQDDMSLAELLTPHDLQQLSRIQAQADFSLICQLKTRRKGQSQIWIYGRNVEFEGQSCLEGWAIDLGLVPDQAQKKDQSLLSSLLDALPDAVYYTDLECRVLGCNRVFADFFGLVPEQLIGRLSYELESMENRRESQLQEIAQVAAGGSLQQEITLMYRGELQYIELIKVPYYSQNQIIGMIAIGRDISARTRQEQALKQSAEDFRQLLEGMPVPVLVIAQQPSNNQDLQRLTTQSFLTNPLSMTQLPYINSAFSSSFGWDPQDVSDFDAWCQQSFPDPDYRQQMLALFGQILSALNPEQPHGETLKHWLSCKNGQPRLVEASASLAGERIIITYHDITELQQAEDALRESEASTRQMLDAVPAGIFVVDHRGQAVYANQRAREISGRGKRLSDPAFRPDQADQTYFKPDGQPYPFQELPLVRALQGESAEANDVTLWQAPDTIPLEIKASPIRDKKGRVSHAVAVFEDITERQRRERELIEAREKAEDASRAKGDFLANMSHEIRTPLHAIIGLNQLMLRTNLEERQLDYVQSNQQAARNLLGILNDILDMSKIEAGMLHLERTPFELNEVLANLFNLLGRKAQDKGLELVVKIDESLPSQLIGDPLRLEQVLVNLVGNAIKFTASGEVSLTVKPLGQDPQSVHLCFEVRDTGIGISEAEGARLFQAFSQADTSTTRNYGGTGLGLSISRVLVGLMGGQIGFTSHPGQGSCFYFDVYLGSQAQSAAASQRLPLDLGSKKILIIDDHQIVLDIVSDYLKRFGIRPDIWLASPETLPELQRLSQATAYDLLLVDWRLPGLDPVNLTHYFEHQSSEPQRVLMTAATPDELPQTGLASDFKRVLHKPITPSQLYNLLSDLFGGQVSQRSQFEPQDGYFKELLLPFQGTRLLLVEDHPVNQRVARELLEGYGFIVDIAGNGADALIALDQQPNEFYALVLMDLQMPVMDGFEATRLIRARERFRNLPILAMTADAIEGVKAKALDAGMNDYLTKPIDLDQLLGQIHRWLLQAPVPIPVKVAVKSPIQSDFPIIPGIDLKSALRRTGGNRNLYLDLVTECAGIMRQQRQELAQALADSETPQAISLAHAIRGAAANLGLIEIAKSMAELETVLKSGAEFELFWLAGQAALDQFDTQLPQLDQVLKA